MISRLRRAAREALLWAGAALGALAVVLGVGTALFDTSLLVFRSGSMAPQIQTGALALARTVDADSVRAGDVVSVVSSEGARITHRVVSVTDHGDRATLTLQGDANAAPDAELYDVRQVERVLLDVPYAGYVTAHMLTPSGLVAAAAWGTLLFSLTRPSPGGPSDGGRHRGGGTATARPQRQARPRRGIRPVIRPATSVASVTAAAMLGGSAFLGTFALFDDRAAMATGTFLAAQMQTPTNVRCVDQGFRDYIGWTAPAGPSPSGYRVVATHTNGQVTTEDVGPAITEWRPTAPGTYNVRVASVRGSWVSAPSQVARIGTQSFFGFLVTTC